MKKWLGLVLAALLLVSAMPAAAQAEEGTTQTEVAAKGEQKGTIVNCKTSVNVREKASSQSKLLGTAKKGETYDVIGVFGSWVKIDFEGKEGYVYNTYIKIEGEPDDTAITGKVGTIVNVKNSANVREKATSSSKLLGTAKKGATYKVLAKAGNWVKIQYTSEQDGYVYKSYIKLRDEGSETPVSGKTAKIVNCKTCVNVREKATSNSKLLGTAARGAIYDVLGTSGDWVKIDYKDGEAGFVHKKFVKITEPEEDIDGKTGTITCKNKVNVRAKATTDSKLLGTAKNGETFTVHGRSGNWVRIDYNGKTGYVYKTYIKIG
jgi:probable enterotoxin B